MEKNVETKKPFFKNIFKQKQVDIAFMIVVSIANVLVMTFSLLSISSYGSNLDFNSFPKYLSYAFFCLALSRITLGIFYWQREKDKVELIKNVIFGVIYLTIAAILLFGPMNTILYCSVFVLYLFTVAANRISICFKYRHISTYIFNGIFAALAIALAITVLVNINDAKIFDAVLLLVVSAILLVSIFETLTFAFSRIRMRGIIRIMHDTYVFEILYGLILIIITFSFYFFLIEPGVTSYGDALWYSFCVITTIGFGDVTVSTLGSRILSVILGIYGIVVVAVVTSVVVNYYNELKDERKEKENDNNHKDDDSGEQKEDDKVG